MVEWAQKEVIYVVVAILLSLMAFQAVGKWCNLYFADQDKAKAEGTLQEFSDFLDSIKVGQQNNYTLVSPSGYYFQTFDISRSTVPQCHNDNCACICGGKDCEIDEKIWCKTLKVSPGNFKAVLKISFPNSEQIVANRTASGFILTSNINGESVEGVPGFGTPH